MNASVASKPGHKRGESLTTDPQIRNAIQREAQKVDAIVAIHESVVDLSVFDGGDQPGRRDTVFTQSGDLNSYYFPEDPEKPAWRPISMRWPYISLLVILAISLAGLQEFLCQISQRNSEGLLKFQTPKDITILAYFTWKYLPTIILVTYGVMWQVVDYEVKRLEPYYQLSQREGAIARASLNLDYLTAMAYLIPLRAIRYKQWAVVCSSTAAIISGSLLAVLQSAAVEVTPKYTTGKEDKRVMVDPIFSRCLTAALLIVATCGICLLFALRRKSGLLSDPKGIAGIAAMATKSHILVDFKGLDIATNNRIHDKLRTRRYNLHKSSLWQGKFVRGEKHTPPDKNENPHPVMLRLITGIPYVFYIVVVAALLPFFIFDQKANIVTIRTPWVLTALATGVKIGWGAIDIELRVLEPYYILLQRNAPPKTLTLDYTGTVPGYLSFKAALNRHWLIAAVSFGAILTEVLTVCATSFTVDGRKFVAGHGGDGNETDDRQNSTETFRSFWTSFALAGGILIYLVIVACIVYLRRGRVFLPRQPGSIAGVLAYIHQSRMLDDFIDTERKDADMMTKHLEKIGKTYALGWFRGRDHEDHCGVDQEPMDASYEHGKDWDKGRLTGQEIQGWEMF
ncbi:hypothetical protein BT63DRAFT_379578 [Microthyrium microscopicum]|uniref:Uncharacterized protein n=1 Tax=Microthyrium microscopicum TaxID=703497 RepID=A0A6A6TX72_9PEZI|nr:hypothetical protein BT63DRAFT_379578 [Microthyrium microscopicum]